MSENSVTKTVGDTMQTIPSEKLDLGTPEFELAFARRLLPALGVFLAIVLGVMLRREGNEEVDLAWNQIVSIGLVAIGAITLLGCSLPGTTGGGREELAMLRGAGLAIALLGAQAGAWDQLVGAGAVAAFGIVVAVLLKRANANNLAVPAIAAWTVVPFEDTVETITLTLGFLLVVAVVAARVGVRRVVYFALAGMGFVALATDQDRKIGLIIGAMLVLAGIVGLFIDIRARNDSQSVLRQSLGVLPVSAVLLALLSISGLKESSLIMAFGTGLAAYQLVLALCGGVRRWDRVSYSIASLAIVVSAAGREMSEVSQRVLVVLILAALCVVSRRLASDAARAMALLIGVVFQVSLFVTMDEAESAFRQDPGWLAGLTIATALVLYSISADWSRSSERWWRGVIAESTAAELTNAAHVIMEWLANAPISKVVMGIVGGAFRWIGFLARKDRGGVLDGLGPYVFAAAGVGACLVLARGAGSLAHSNPEGPIDPGTVLSTHGMLVSAAWCGWGLGLYAYGALRRQLYPRVLGVVFHLVPLAWMLATASAHGETEWIGNLWTVGCSLTVLGVGSLRVRSTVPVT